MTDTHLIEALARHAHRHQRDKQGRPYVTHLHNVAWGVLFEHRIVAWLHDYFEDVAVDMGEILEFRDYLTLEDCEALYLLTRQPDITYKQYILDILDSGNQTALAVKLSDILDHLHDIESLENPSLKKRYTWALETLTR